MADRIIIVSGIMNSGTSAAASILHHLGIDFGYFYTLEELQTIKQSQINDPEKRYQDFEDKNAYKVLQWATSQEGVLSVEQLAKGFAGYFHQRLEACKTIVGFKMPMFGVMGSLDSKALFEDLPIEILAVKRPIDEVFDSIERVMPSERLREVHIELSQHIGHLLYGWRLIHRKIKPTLTLKYQAIKDDTEKVVDLIAHAFQLTPTAQQIDAAIGFIKGYRR